MSPQNTQGTPGINVLPARQPGDPIANRRHTRFDGGYMDVYNSVNHRKIYAKRGTQDNKHISHAQGTMFAEKN